GFDLQDKWQNDTRFRLLMALAGLFLLTLGVRLYQSLSLTTLTHDGSIAYCAAAGKQDELARVFTGEYPYGEWVPAAEWKQFIQADTPFCFAAISASLASYDIHPPFYFWWLHVFMLIFDTHAWTGPLLNTCFAVCSAIVLFFLARFCFKDTLLAAAAALIWFACPPAIAASQVARQYDLLTLLSLLLIWRIVRVADADKPPAWPEYGLILFLCVCGPLTHLHFGFAMMGCGVYLLLAWPRIGWKRLFPTLCSMGLGVILFYVLHPSILDSVERGKTQLQPFSQGALQTRFELIPQMLAQFWGLPIPFQILTWLFVIASVVFFLLHLIRQFYPSFLSKWPMPKAEFPLVFFFLWNLGFISALYLAFLSPGHAMGDRYLSLVWPFMACMCVVYLRYLPRNPEVAGLILGAALLLATYVNPIVSERVDLPQVDPVPHLEKADALLIDNPSRGYLLQLIHVLPEKKMAFVAYQKSILERPEAMLKQTFPMLCYYNLNAYGNTLDMHKQIIGILREHYYMQLKLRAAWSHGQMYFGVRKYKK
ncbi:hypothetical protein GF373_07135, partial [bacterium]|nr:hypothetical protein [bacterium]